MKHCRTCKQNKPFDDFYKKNNRKSSFSPDCKVCFRIKSSHRYQENKERRKNQMKQWRSENTESVREYEKNRCKLEHRKNTSRKYSKNRYLARKDEILLRNKKMG